MTLQQDIRAHLHFIKARLRVLLTPGVKLPPGELDPSENSMYSDPMFYLDRFKKHGPVFKTSWGRHLLVCIQGNAEGRRFLNTHQDKLRGISLSLKKLFPGGFLRNMTGEEHKTYRKILGTPLSSDLIAVHDQALRTLMRKSLSAYCLACQNEGPSRASFLRHLNIISSQALIHLIYGVPTSDPRFHELWSLHDELGKDDLVWRTSDREKKLFEQIRGHVCRLAESKPGPVDGSGRSCLSDICEQGTPDETVIGNLIYMVEMGRYDLYGLLHWVAKYLSGSPETINALRDGPRTCPAGHGGSDTAIPLSRAVVLETLRLDQGEGVARRASGDIVHDGHLFQEGTMFRMCLWDNHKNPDRFPDPFRFDPTRFVKRDYQIDDWAPFGLDAHRCIGAEISIGLATLFVEELATGFAWDVVDDGPRIRGAYHWEPSDKFVVSLNQRTPSI